MANDSVVEKSCLYCKSAILGASNRKYCNSECCSRYHKNIKFYSARPHLVGPMQCEICRVGFAPFIKDGATRFKYCSDDCASLSMRVQSSKGRELRPIESRACCICNSEFQTKRHSELKTCSDGCHKELRSRVLVERPLLRPVGQDAECSKCGITKHSDQFRQQVAKVSGRLSLQSWCKGCQLESAKKQRAKEGYRDWHKQYKKEYVRNNRDALREYARIRRKEDPVYALKMRMSSALRTLIKKNGRTTFSYFNFSAQELKEHIGKKFTDDMNWDLFSIPGKIHIDHIIPKSVFDHNVSDEVTDCWSLANLRPMWAENNLRKGSRACAKEACPVLWMKYGHRVERIVNDPHW